MPEPSPKSDRASPSLPLQVADSLADDCVPPEEDRREIGEEGERVAEEERDEGRRRDDEEMILCSCPDASTEHIEVEKQRFVSFFYVQDDLEFLEGLCPFASPIGALVVLSISLTMFDHLCGCPFNVDTSKKQEGCCKNPKSISSNSERSFVNSSNSHAQYFRDGDLGNGSPSKLHYKKTSEDKNEELCQPKKRPWSSPFIQHERENKNPAIVCDFFAQGWCIKGSSCRFLHKKEVVGDSGLETQEGISDMPISEYSTKPDFHLQRSLVRTYGKEMHGLSEFKSHDILHASKNFFDEHFQSGSGRTSALLGDEVRQESMFQRKNTITGLIPMVDFTADRYSTSGEISSRHFSNERMMYKEMPIGDHRNDASSLTENPLISESVLFSGVSSTPIDVHRDSDDAYSFGEKPDDLSGQHRGSCFTIHDSSCLTSFKSNFDNSTYSIQGSAATESLHSFAQAGTRFIHGLPVSDERGDVHTMLNHCSNFTTYGQPNVAGDSLSRLQQNLEENTWENSIPFQPSFSFASFIESCSDSQFDPLGSNIGHPKEVTTPVLAGDFKPGYDANKSANSFTSASDTATVAPGLTTNDEKGNIPRITDPAPINDAKVGNNMRDVNNLDNNIMESKSMKMVYAALVDFLKELLKPWWKEGHLSRDTHKLIVKKTTEKVLGALQPHQVPNSPLSIQQYLSSSRPKLLKLVEVYSLPWQSKPKGRADDFSLKLKFPMSMGSERKISVDPLSLKLVAEDGGAPPAVDSPLFLLPPLAQPDLFSGSLQGGSFKSPNLAQQRHHLAAVTSLGRQHSLALSRFAAEQRAALCRSKSCGEGRSSVPSDGFIDILSSRESAARVAPGREQSHSVGSGEPRAEQRVKCGCLFLPGLSHKKKQMSLRNRSQMEEEEEDEEEEEEEEVEVMDASHVSRTVSLEKFENASWNSSSPVSGSPRGSLFHFPTELLLIGRSETNSPVRAAFVFDGGAGNAKTVLKRSLSRLGSSKSQGALLSNRHVRFTATAAPISEPASPSSAPITPRLQKAREEFDAYLEAQCA
ncbi:hypothetical protein ZIOFF_037217 [Zingiber officinale]|uniref:C3H1-type domain-containing protein n=1 Tax=Zingiber officinale TaxID=94328 RepID=A0A8J5GJS6_ZINOF|nr:hypothetical protein ZIOFF_037217 [Zingiber officinale]